ncbi:MAG: dihydroorotate dehydrogenase [Rickettsiales bacterium]|jgi:dihydroorotate dehydrogenase (NAD+) catalytic subunit|nr:dihydroorotate dehydrogenase [Rickettsiales bacterium]
MKQDKQIKVFANYEIAPGVMEMILESPRIAGTAKPGQFVNLAVADGKLRRPFAISRVDAELKTFTVRYRVIGDGTRILSKMHFGGRIMCMGPLGNGFDLIRNGGGRYDQKRAAIVCGGMGAAAAPFLNDSLDTMYTDIIIGGRNRQDVEFWDSAIRAGADGIHFTTEDGSFGEKGLATDKLQKMLADSDISGTKSIDIIYACGPVGMMKAAAGIAKSAGIRCQALLESEMGCGIGACKSCTCLSKDGGARSVCADGPVFDADEINWDYLIQKEDLKQPKIEVVGPNRAPFGGFKNPYIAASGCAGFGLEQEGVADMSLFGAIALKGLTEKPRVGNPGRRIAELADGGVMNSIGLENPGVAKFLAQTLPAIKAADWYGKTKVIANFSGATPKEYGDMASFLDVDGIDMVEVNISCPNLDKKIIGTDAEETRVVVSAVRHNTSKPVIVKLTPNVANITEIARAAAGGGADAISLVNTVVGFDINPATARATFYNGVAGISGNATVRNIALAKVVELAKAVDVPIIGGGGIQNHEDVVRFALAGAESYQIGTEFLRRPRMIETLPGEVDEYVAKYYAGKRLRDIVGAIPGRQRP